MIDFNEVVEAGDHNYNLISFSWDLVDVCQYNCSYCASMNFNLNTFKNDPTLRYAWKKVVKLLGLNSIKNKFSVELLGGEPTLHPDIFEIVTELCKIKNCIQVEVITNLAKPLSFYEKFNKEEFTKVCIVSSFHPEYYKPIFIEKIIKLNKLEYINIFPNINLSDNKDKWELTKNVILELQNNNVKVGVNILQDVEDGVVGNWNRKYSDEFYEYFKYILDNATQKSNMLKEDIYRLEYVPLTIQIPYKLTNGNIINLSESEINQYNLRKFKGWKCNALMYHIHMDGTIYNHCTQEQIMPLDLNSKKLTACVTCPLDHCDCDTKFLYVKKKNEI
jgi:organic radical activating enzyme